jgi:hypothetical protein
LAKKLKILRLSYTPPNYKYSNDASVFKELSKQADVVFLDFVKIKDPFTIDTRISELLKKHNFDLILKNYVGPSVRTLKMKPLHEYGIPIFVSAGDCHTRLQSPDLLKRSNHHKFNTIIVNNNSTVSCFKDYFDRDMDYIWLPWSYNPKVHKDYNIGKTHDISLPASRLKIAIRQQIHQYLLKNSSWKYTWIGKLTPAEYSKKISQCKIGVSTCQIEHRQIYKGKFIGMTFTKYYEIPMSGALHIGQEGGDVEELGFIDGENVVMFNTFEEFKDKFKFYLNNEKERLRILKNSRKHVKPMTYENRIKEFLVEVRKRI